MRKLTSIALLGMALTAYSAPLTPEQAMQRVSGEGPARVRGSIKGMPLLDTRMEKSLNTVYLFGGDNGFVVASADDAAPAVLGYGDGPVATESGKLPDNFSYWLDFLSRRVSMIAEAGSDGALSYKHLDAEAIGPLCQTQWNQDSPYNDLCPTDYGGRCVTGCVATAMSQALKFHNWPPQGEGEYTYYWANGDKDITTDFSSYNFDWDNMLNTYDYHATSAQKKAVAELMRAAGGSVAMGYSSNASGAYSTVIAGAFGTYFRYDKSIQYVMRDYYTLKQWEEMIYASLRDCGPVVYDGQSAAGGHSFICDGYAGDGYFHINWGWGGSSDGNFYLDVLDPGNQGIGGSNMDFNSGQDAILGMKPDVDGTSVEGNPMMWSDTGFKVPYQSALAAGDYTQMVGGFYNYGPFAIPGTTHCAVSYIPLYGGTPYRDSFELEEEVNVHWGFSSLDIVIPESLEDGMYGMYIELSKDGENWYPIMVARDAPAFNVAFAETDASGNKTVTFRRLKISVPEVVTGAFPSTIDIDNVSVNMPYELTNTGETTLSRALRLEILKDGKVYAYGTMQALKVRGEETYAGDYTCNQLTLADDAEDAVVKPGNYKMCLSVANNAINDFYLPVTEVVDVELTGGSSGVAGIDGGDAVAPTVWYDMQGRMISTDADNMPAPGVYVKRNGAKAEKVLVK